MVLTTGGISFFFFLPASSVEESEPPIIVEPMYCPSLTMDEISNDLLWNPSLRSALTPSESYYRFYQTKLRQLLTQTRNRKEQELRLSRQKLGKRAFTPQQYCIEYMNQIQERSRQPSIHRKDSDDTPMPEAGPTSAGVRPKSTQKNKPSTP